MSALWGVKSILYYMMGSKDIMTCSKANRSSIYVSGTVSCTSTLAIPEGQ